VYSPSKLVLASCVGYWWSEGAKESHELGTDKKKKPCLVCLSILLLLHLSSLPGVQEELFQGEESTLSTAFFVVCLVLEPK
jgi:hypothetical protein